MILIIHGNDIESSRNYFYEEKNKLKNFTLISGENLTYDMIFQLAENKSLFSESTILLIENFFSKNKTNSAEFKKIISYLNTNKNISIIFWEQTELSKSSISSLKNSTVKSFNLPKNLFLFLDNLKPGNTNLLIKLHHELKKTTADELILFMIIRHFRMLVGLSGDSSKISEIKNLASWQISKLKTLRSHYTNEALMKSYSNLFNIEEAQKTGKQQQPLEQSIDFFLAGL